MDYPYIYVCALKRYRALGRLWVRRGDIFFDPDAVFRCHGITIEIQGNKRDVKKLADAEIYIGDLMSKPVLASLMVGSQPFQIFPAFRFKAGGLLTFEFRPALPPGKLLGRKAHGRGLRVSLCLVGSKEYEGLPPITEENEDAKEKED